MGYTCFVPECKANYPTNKKEESKSVIPLVQIFVRPSSMSKMDQSYSTKNLKISDIQYAEFMPNIFCHVFKALNTDSPNIKKSGNELVELKRFELKLSAIPLNFSNLPKYLSNKPFPKCFDQSITLH